MKRKKLLAVLTAAAMTVSTGVSAVSASTAYQDAEKAALAEAITEITEQYASSLSDYSEQVSSPSGADITLTLDDTGKAILGMLVPADISWISDLQLSADVSQSDGQLAESIDVNLNGTKILTMEVYMDYTTWDTYIRIPELSDAYLKTNALTATEEAADDSSFSITSSVENPEFMQAYLNAVSNLEEYLPTADELGTLLDRYGNLIIDAFGEGLSGTETLTVGDISVDCTTEEGILTQAESLPALESILTTARDDAELKTLIEKWASLDTSGELSYDAFQSGIDELLAELADSESSDGSVTGDTSAADEESSTEDSTETTDSSAAENSVETADSYLSSKIWLDSEGNIAGRRISLIDSYSDPLTISWLNPSTDAGSALQILYSDGSYTYDFSGTGTFDGDLLNGYYELSLNGFGIAAVTVTDYDTAQMADGILNGTYEISLLDGIGEDVYASLGSFGLTLAAAGGKTDGTLTLTLTGSGVPYGSLSVAVREGETVEFPDVSTLGTVYDSANDEDALEYVSSITTDTLLANLSAAGMPDDFIDTLLSAMYGTEETTEDTTYDESAVIGEADESTEIYLEDTTETATAAAA